MAGYFDIMNGTPLYLMVIASLVIIGGLCVVVAVRAYRRAGELGMDKGTLMTIIRASAIYTIAPSLAIVIGLFSLAPVLGIPWSWFRLSVLGAVNYELMAADMIATSSGYGSLAELAQSNDPSLTGTIMLTMSVGILVALLFSLICGKKIQGGVSGVMEKHPENGALLMASFSLAIVVVFGPMQMVSGTVKMLTFLVSMVITLVQLLLIKKFRLNWLKNFTLANALLLGMVCSVLLEKLFG